MVITFPWFLFYSPGCQRFSGLPRCGPCVGSSGWGQEPGGIDVPGLRGIRRLEGHMWLCLSHAETFGMCYSQDLLDSRCWPPQCHNLSFTTTCLYVEASLGTGRGPQL